jgi:hypothetical protein
MAISALTRFKGFDSSRSQHKNGISDALIQPGGKMVVH